ncbi:hypothetical protein Bpfe_003759 [Biomphalaria pfeifferi]|uniref:SMB domain-containing protein n=1 Tax=Biomphalaria pfeifferi TaxID=112525 RepID=A0AAD8FL17_BIOPF|nr:hypothetical protein Bpfe_003759 [Biomphalaria pfeifferi]
MWTIVLIYFHLLMIGVATKNLVTENLATKNVATENITVENLRTENVAVETKATKNERKENVTAENVATENVTVQNITNENVSNARTFSTRKSRFHHDNVRLSRSRLPQVDIDLSCRDKCKGQQKSPCSCLKTFSVCCADFSTRCRYIDKNFIVSSPEELVLNAANKTSSGEFLQGNFTETQNKSSPFITNENNTTLAFRKKKQILSKELIQVAHKKYKSKTSVQFDDKTDKNGAKREEYVFPKFLCTEDGALFIPSCVTDPNKEGFSLSRPTLTPYVYSEDETNYFPVSDLTTGYTYINWNIFNCFAQNYSKPLIWKAYLKDLAIQKMQSYIYVVVEYQRLLFARPQDEEVRLLLCQNESAEISENASLAPFCAKCRSMTSLPIYNDKLDYPISVTSTVNYLSFKSSAISNPWSKLGCKVTDGSTKAPKYLNCRITNYKSNFAEQISTKELSMYVLKLTFAEKSLDAHYMGHFSEVFICFLRHFASINAVKLWRPSSFSYFPMIKDYFFTLKILIHDHFLFPTNNKIVVQESFKMLLRIILILSRDKELLILSNGEADLGINKEKLPEWDGIVNFTKLELENSLNHIVCGCGVSLRELYAFNYLEHWLCELQCEQFTIDQENFTDDVIDSKKLCFSNICLTIKLRNQDLLLMSS